jgi:hypothetical protein
LGESSEHETIGSEAALGEGLINGGSDGADARSELVEVGTILVDPVPAGALVEFDTRSGRHDAPDPFGIEHHRPREESFRSVAETRQEEQKSIGIGRTAHQDFERLWLEGF